MNTWPGYQIATYGQATGIFKKYGLDVELVRFINQQDNIRATMRESQDASFVPLAEVMQVDVMEDSPVFILVVDVSSGSDGIASRPGIGSVKELRGKKISAKLGTVSHLILLEALEASGVKPEDVDIVDVSNEQGAEMLKKGQIDSAVLWEPLLQTTAESIGGKVIHSTALVDSIVVDGLTTRASLLTTKQDELVNFIRAWLEIMKEIDRNPELVFSTVAKQIGMTKTDFVRDYSGLKKGDLSLNRKMLQQGRLKEVYEKTKRLLLSDPRHGRIIRDDVRIEPDLFYKATRN